MLLVGIKRPASLSFGSANRFQSSQEIFRIFTRVSLCRASKIALETILSTANGLYGIVLPNLSAVQKGTFLAFTQAFYHLCSAKIIFTCQLSMLSFD